MKRMTKETAAGLKSGAWGFVIGAVIAMILGFTWGGWVTASTASEMRDTAVLANQSDICVAQFMQAPNFKAEAKAFEATDSWKRDEFVQKGGWDKMPGEASASSVVAGPCAAGIAGQLKL